MSLKERRDLHELHREGNRGVLFTLLDVRGSSYRQPGARLFAATGGATAGTLSGGCLEADLLRRAEWYVRDGAGIHGFSTAFDDTAEIPYGLGCGGEVDVLSEPAHAEEATALLDAIAATLAGEHRTIVTVLPHASQTLQRFIMDAAGDVLFASESLETEDLVPLRRSALRSQHATIQQVAQVRIFVELLEPVQRLVIFGAGEDARPLATMAHTMGWRVAVVDTRTHRVTADRFPLAEERVVAPDATHVREDDVVMVMTHSYEQDRSIIAHLLRNRPRFVGLLGARHRSALLLKEAADLAGVTFTAAVEAVHSPVGLHLGGEGPEAIALAVVAEMQAVLHDGAQVRSRRMTLEQANDALAKGQLTVQDTVCRVRTDADTTAVNA